MEEEILNEMAAQIGQNAKNANDCFIMILCKIEALIQTLGLSEEQREELEERTNELLRNSKFKADQAREMGVLKNNKEDRVN